jgi:hypothetical protein
MRLSAAIASTAVAVRQFLRTSPSSLFIFKRVVIVGAPLSLTPSPVRQNLRTPELIRNFFY